MDWKKPLNVMIGLTENGRLTPILVSVIIYWIKTICDAEREAIRRRYLDIMSPKK